MNHRPIRNKNCLWRPCLLMDHEMSNLYRGPSIDASYQVFRHWPTRNQNCLWPPCFLTDYERMSNLYRGPSIDASYQVSLHLAKRFQRIRLKCEKLTDVKWWQKITLPLARWAKKRKLSEFLFFLLIFHFPFQ